MDLELLLAHADDASPVLESGLPLESAAAEARAADTHHVGPFPVPEGDPNDLTLQRWGIIAPEGPEGDRLLDLVEPLRKQRQEDQGGEPIRVYRVPAGMDAAASMRWKKLVYRDESVAEEERPLYLLALGDLDLVSLDLQRTLASDLLIGRLVCPSAEGYAVYVEKVLRWQREPSAVTRAQALFFTARDGTAATTIGHRSLVTPSLERCRERQQKGSFRAQEVDEIAYEDALAARDALLEQIGRPEPAMLFTMSHGLGAPRGGWKSVDEQRAVQGAMSLGPGVRLTAEDIASRPFLPGGIWFFLACYGGGTPAVSAYHHWLARLREVGGFRGRVDAVLAGLPKPEDRPFIAALPQAALANPNGPLALIAHVDLAWTYSFQDLGADGQDRPSRFEGIFRSLVNGARSGISYNNLLHYLSETSVELTTLLDDEERLAARGTPVASDAARVKEKANLWMLRQDLGGYLLLGDPATRLPLAPGAAAAKASPAPAVARSAPAPGPIAKAPAAVEAHDVAAMQRAVHEVIAGGKGHEVIAREHGISRAELERWVDEYCAAGRAALAKLRR